PTTTKRTCCAARASISARKFATTGCAPNLLHLLGERAHPLDPLGRREPELLLDQGDVDPRRDLLQDFVLPPSSRHHSECNTLRAAPVAGVPAAPTAVVTGHPDRRAMGGAHRVLGVT